MFIYSLSLVITYAAIVSSIGQIFLHTLVINATIFTIFVRRISVFCFLQLCSRWCCLCKLNATYIRTYLPTTSERRSTYCSAWGVGPWANRTAHCFAAF